MADERENPEMTDLGGEVTPGSDEKANLPGRIERYSRAKERATLMQRWCEDNDCPEADALRVCGNWLKFHHYFTVDKVRLAAANFCQKHLLCPLCAIRRGSKLTQTYLEKFQALREAHSGLYCCMVTLTVRNSDDLDERVDHLKSSIQRLNTRRREYLKRGRGKSEWRKILAAAGSIEVKKGKNSKQWHPHAHVLVMATAPLDQELLRDEWFKITGDSHQVDVTPLKHPEDPAQDFVEIFKYALKFSSMEPSDTFQAYLILTKKRLLFSIGEFRGLKIPKQLTDEPLENLPYIELFYRYLPGSGYNLERTTRSEDLE
jgi:hypothetical protein